jgi:hypothetical protein
MIFDFTLDDDIVVSQPGGFADITMNIKRDPNTHGFLFEATSTNLVFNSVGANYLSNVMDREGLKAKVKFTSRYKCDPLDEWELFLSGNIDLGSYVELCGNECSVSVSVEQEGCGMLITNLYDQKVDLDSTKAFDGFTALEKYDRLGFDLSIAAKQLPIGAQGSVVDEGDVVSFEIFAVAVVNTYFVRPTYGNKINESIKNTELEPTVYAASDNHLNDEVLSPIVLIDDAASISCLEPSFNYTARLKGSYSLKTGGGSKLSLELRRGKVGEYGPGLGGFTQNLTLIDSLLITESSPNTGLATPITGTFDWIKTGTITLAPGEGLWQYFRFEDDVFGFVPEECSVTFDKETAVNISGVSECPASAARMYMINESLSHVVEAITNGCMRVKSDYYGRIDSQPYSNYFDGCGALRAITNGLLLRKAISPNYFISFKDLYENLNPIDNLGYGFEADPMRPGFQVVRVEPVEYFYKNIEIFSCPNATSVQRKIDVSRYYSTIKIGYEKWQIESINGLDEVNSNREYRTSLTSVNNTLAEQSKFIAGGYPIELTRQQSFAATGGADTSYDNDTFILCLKRKVYNFEVESGNVTGTGFYSPATMINWRIRPYYNLMRWFKTIAASYPNIVDTDNRLFFTSGTGNYKAVGEMISESCKLENGPKAENADLRATDFENPADAFPLWKPKPITFNYPVSIQEYRKIKAMPYGYISVQCGDGQWLKGFIDAFQLKPIEGTANITLREKWQ